MTSKEVYDLILSRHRAMVWRVQCRQKFLEQMGFIPGFEMTLPQQNFTNLTRDDLSDVLRRVKCSTPAGEPPTQGEVEYMYHVCVTKCDDFVGQREEGDEDGVNIFDIQFAYSTYFVFNDRPVDVQSRVDQFFAPMPGAAVGMDGEADAGSIGDEDLFIVMNDLVGNLVTPIANASIMVSMEAPPAYDVDDDFDELLTTKLPSLVLVLMLVLVLV